VTLPKAAHWKNVGYLLSVECFWGISLALISMVAILPVFLTHLGASNAALGILPVVWILASSFPGIFASHYTSNQAHRKRAVILLHVAAAIPWLFIAAWFGLFPRPSPAVDIAVFIATWGVAWVWMGFTIPVWINFVGKVTRADMRARSFATIFFFQTMMGAIGGWAASRVLGSGLPFPANYALGFLIAGICMAAGAVFFLPVREEAGAVSEPGQPWPTVVRHAREIWADRSGIRVYLWILFLTTGCYLLITYYPVFAERRFHLTARDSAFYTALCMAGQMVGSILTGLIGDRFGYARVSLIATVALVIGLSLAIWSGHPAVYYVTAFALGIFLVADRIALYNLSMAFSPHEDNTAYLGIVPAMVAPLMAVVAGSSGALIDRFSFVPVAAVGLVGAAAALFLALFRLPEPRYSLAGRRNSS
jgi:predicted MFS family arabinose efflux permease